MQISSPLLNGHNKIECDFFNCIKKFLMLTNFTIFNYSIEFLLGGIRLPKINSIHPNKVLFHFRVLDHLLGYFDDLQQLRLKVL